MPVYKDYLSNAPDGLPLITLIWAGGRRRPIERSITEGKDAVGLDHFECRFRRGRHRHMTLVILAQHLPAPLTPSASSIAGVALPDNSRAVHSATNHFNYPVIFRILSAFGLCYTLHTLDTHWTDKVCHAPLLCWIVAARQ